MLPNVIKVCIFNYHKPIKGLMWNGVCATPWARLDSLLTSYVAWLWY